METAGGVVVGNLFQRRDTISPGTFLGRGKVGELKDLIQDSSADVVVFDADLSPGQVRNLEKSLGVKVVDRSEVILDIFAQRARTREARVQVELAQLEYLLPRLTRLWQHLSRLGGGIGTRGPGETQLEVDRRRVRERIASLKKQLERVDKERQVQRKARERVFSVAIVGYTNAGKSTLFRALTETDAFVEDRLFATLDAKARRLHGRRVPPVVVTDTVGFIRKLPHHLTTSFRATLDEVRHADLLVHVVDSNSAHADEQIQVVETVLREIDAGGKKTIIALNKADVAHEDTVSGLKRRHPGAVVISALKNENIDSIVEGVLEAVRMEKLLATVELPLSEEHLLAHIKGSCELEQEKVLSGRVRIRFWAGEKELGQLASRGISVQVDRAGVAGGGRRRLGAHTHKRR